MTSVEQKYIKYGASLVGFSGKDVLEVGGCLTPGLVAPYKPKSWTAIDINTRRFEDKEFSGLTFPFVAEKMSVTNIGFPDNSFDRIFSINCFEHVDDMQKAVAEMYRVLRPGGTLVTLFGPIWSAPVGHHTWVEHEGTLYHFGSGVFPDWFHLTKTRSELFEYLEARYNAGAAEKICRYVYDSGDLNRLTDGDFIELLNSSKFKTVFSISNKKGARVDKQLLKDIRNSYPACQNPRITEFLFVLSKGQPTPKAFLKAYAGFLGIVGDKAMAKIRGGS